MVTVALSYSNSLKFAGQKTAANIGIAASAA